MRIAILVFSISLLLSCSSGKKTSEENAGLSSNDVDTTAASSSTVESEEQETQRLAQEKAVEDEKVFSELSIYDDKYTLQPESEGAEGTLELKYMEDIVFTFKLNLKALDICMGTIDGEIFMDRTQHGLYQNDNCLLHFNFMGSYADSRNVVEIEQPDKCGLMEGDCIFTGKYVTGG